MKVTKNGRAKIISGENHYILRQKNSRVLNVQYPRSMQNFSSSQTYQYVIINEGTPSI